jgi:predicted RNA binding protein YcfA (HicA-like mRNA interferase family)
MKRRDLLQHLREHGCRFVREGGDHSIWENPQKKLKTSIPRHREIHEYTAGRICRQLGVPEPGNAD